ncbi:HEAT repeat domain-containing protein [Candidatus Nitrospira neomarina]|uniref:HEAT repeat domain-containing protein n=1 Tax=Candidatus Nitrospira neomarina TaxID=3020899 RepID=A0AA96GMD2_9BACT|nr:HEAT repeat domain-containing protein [Candidatus Nitrospira neomarina]WNM60889.1 HEAT repeat domain-containing protein [Candidatus Nitrospira neomarina]
MRDDQNNIDDAFSDQTEEFVSLEGKTTLPQDELVDEVSEAITAEADEETADTVASAETEEGVEPEEELVEEQVKDEIDIQIDLLNDSEWVVRREAVITLGEMGDERCVEPLVRCLRDGDWQVRDAAVEAIAMIGSPAVDLLLRYIRDYDARKSVIKALGKINDERVLDPLISMLHNDEFKDDATWALAELGQPAVGRLLECLKNQDEVIRKQAILALGEIKDASCVDLLIERLQDPDWFIRLSSAAALEKIGDPRGREAIKPLMKDPDLVVRLRIERMLAAWKKQAVTA